MSLDSNTQGHWFCGACGTFDGPIAGEFCDVCADGSEVERFVSVKVAANWLMHADRLDEIPGATAALPAKNPLWDAGVAMVERFGGSL